MLQQGGGAFLLQQGAGHAAEAAGGQLAAVLIQEIHLPGALLPQGADGEPAGAERGIILSHGDLRGEGLLKGFKAGAGIHGAVKMNDPDADDVLPGRGETDLQGAAVQNIAPGANGPPGDQQGELVSFPGCADALRGVKHPVFGPGHPVSIGKFHGKILLRKAFFNAESVYHGL